MGNGPALQGAVSRGETASTLVNVFAAVGGAALAAGVVLIVVALESSPDREDTSAATLSVAPLRGGAVGGATIRY